MAATLTTFSLTAAELTLASGAPVGRIRTWTGLRGDSALAEELAR